MPDFQQQQQQLANSLVGILHTQPLWVGSPLDPLLEALVNSLPYLGEPDWDTAYRGTLSNILQMYLPNKGISPQPEDDGFMVKTTYAYGGTYTGYQDAFFHGVTLSAAAAQTMAGVKSVNANLDDAAWANYAVLVLTDAIRQTVGLGLDTGKLSAAFTTANATFLPALSASYLAVYQTAFQPTSTALQAIINAGQASAAYAELTKALLNQQFTANINQAIAAGGDSTSAAVWFLYNLWMTLNALGVADVDAVIRQAQAAGLQVPAQVGPGSWWNGGYSSWYIPLSGSDLTAAAAAILKADMPENATVISLNGWQSATNNAPNGYSMSFCLWGELADFVLAATSCFGRGTGVLMADGRVKPIEQVQVGDLVLSSHGPCAVALVESPQRGGRTLYQWNNSAVFATAAHPFRAGAGAGVLRLAIDPWALIDGIPTMTKRGVAPLTEGALLSGRRNKVVADIRVENLRAHPPEYNHQTDQVYDLILDGWSKTQATYYVGGPDVFFAADAETIDPLHHIPGTVAVLTAMQSALPACRQHLKDPARQIPAMLMQMEVGDDITAARRVARLPAQKRKRRPSIPTPDYYLQNGEWDAHASLLEFHLARHYGRMLRREAATGWREKPGKPSTRDHYAVTIHDLELMGENGIPANSAVEIRLDLRGGNLPAENSQTIRLRTGRRPAWHLLVDQVLDFGKMPSTMQPTTLLGTIQIGDTVLGRFRAVLLEDMLHGSGAEYFLFDTDHRIIGRIALEHRWIAPQRLASEKRFSEQWTTRHAAALAMSLGRQIGEQIVAYCQTR